MSKTLVTNWKSIWKFWSVQLNALGILILAFGDAITQAWMHIPANLVGQVPHTQSIALIVFGLGIIARILNQEKTDEKDNS